MFWTGLAGTERDDLPAAFLPGKWHLEMETSPLPRSSVRCRTFVFLPVTLAKRCFRKGRWRYNFSQWEKISQANTPDRTYPSRLSSALTPHLRSSPPRFLTGSAGLSELLFRRSVNASWVTNAEPSALGNRFHGITSPRKQGWELAWAASPGRCHCLWSPLDKWHGTGLCELCQAHGTNHQQPWVVKSGRWFLGLLPGFFFFQQPLQMRVLFQHRGETPAGSPKQHSHHGSTSAAGS